MDPFHEVMRRVRAKLVYLDDELVVGLEDPKLKDLISVADALVESLRISFDEISVTVHDSHIALIAPFGAEQEVVGEEEVGEVEGKKAEEVSEDGIVWLTDKVGYRLENGDLVLVYRGEKASYNLARVDMQKLYELYEELPERANKNDIVQVMKKLNIKFPATNVNYLMLFFSKYPLFDAELVKEGNTNYLVKRDGSVAEEVRKQMAIEKEVIGTPWEVR